MVHKKFIKAQAEQSQELNQKSKELLYEGSESESESFLEPQHQKKQPSVAEASKTIQLRKELKNKFRQARVDQITDKENKEKAFEPIMQRLDKVEKAAKQTNDDLIKKLELMPVMSSSPIRKKGTFAPEYEEPNDSIEFINEEGDENIKTTIDKSMGVTDKGFGDLPRKYLPFPDDKFGILADKNLLHL